MPDFALDALRPFAEGMETNDLPAARREMEPVVVGQVARNGEVHGLCKPICRDRDEGALGIFADVCREGCCMHRRGPTEREMEGRRNLVFVKQQHL